jgi:hypothetical protein
MMHPDTELLMHLAANLVREYPNGVSTVDMHLRMAISLDKTRKILCFARKARLLGVGLEALQGLAAPPPPLDPAPPPAPPPHPAPRPPSPPGWATPSTPGCM